MVPNDKMEQEGEEEDVVSNKQKYRELKRRLKYLVYENECFEHDVRQAQTKLLQLCREKSFLLDQLMRHETVVLSEDSDNETTDYSTEDDDQMDFTTKSTVAKLSKPSSSSSSPHTKQSTTKSTTRTTPNTKKAGQRGVAKQPSAGKGTKAIAKTLNSVKAATPKPALIVSLPFSSIRHSSTPPNASSSGSTPQPPTGGGGKGGFSGAPAAPTVFKKIKSVSSSSSDSSSSSSDSDSDDSSSHSSSSSDKEPEPMDTAQLPTHSLPPLPRMVDTSPSLISQTGSKVIQPKPIPSPVTVVSPNQLTSLALVSPSGVPLLSPVPSSPLLPESQKGPQTTYTLTTTSQGSFQLVPLNTALSTTSSKMLGSLTKSSGMSAFHVVTTPTIQHPPAPGGSGSGALQ